jgi:hypothetical protein
VPHRDACYGNTSSGEGFASKNFLCIALKKGGVYKKYLHSALKASPDQCNATRVGCNPGRSKKGLPA